MKNLEELLTTQLWYQFYKWRENPFRIKVNVAENIFLPLGDIDKKLFEAAVAGDIVNVIGSAGTGKTEHALQLRKALLKKNFLVPYIDLSGTSGDTKSFCDQLLDEIPFSIFKKLAKKRALADRVVKHLIKIGKKKKIVLLIDEAQNIADSTLTDLLRRISDQCKNVALILFSIQELMTIPVFRESLRRRMKIIQMRGLEEEEAEELIRKRITGVDGDGTLPFLPESVEFISKKAQNIPGMLLRYCEELCIRNFYEKKLLKINFEDALSLLGERGPSLSTEKKEEKRFIPVTPPLPQPLVGVEKPLSIQAKRILERLSAQQQKLIFAVHSLPEFSIEELVSPLGSDPHSISTQMRRITKKLGGDVFVICRKEGRKIFWKLSDNYKVLLAKA